MTKPFASQFSRLLHIVSAVILLAMLSIPAAGYGEQDVELACEAFRLQNASSEDPPALLRVRVIPPPGHYLYAHNPGGMGLPTVLTATTEENAPPLPVRYPAGRQKSLSGDPAATYMTYEGAADLFVELPDNVAGRTLQLSMTGLLCSDTTCLPVAVTRETTLPAAFETLPLFAEPWTEAAMTAAASGKKAIHTETDPALADSSFRLPDFTPHSYTPRLEVRGLGKAALLAFLAGIILNFMPCVLPVASLKLKGILTGCGNLSSRHAKKCFRSYNLWFAGGVLSYFLFLSMIFSWLGLAWGEIFQEPALILGMTVMVFAMALSLFGVFSLPIIDLKSGPQTGDPTAAKAFFTGALATLLATPCSGPFLGGVLAWALLQPPAVIAVVFLCIGLGMASPYLFMAARPHLILPFQRPGAWTGVVEKLAAFMLTGTSLYLLHILPASLLMPALSVLLVTAFAAWMWGGWTGPAKSAVHRVLVRTTAMLLLAASFAWALSPAPPAPGWHTFDPVVLEQSLGRDPILVEFTADWCPNCIFLEKTVLTSDNLSRWKKRYGLRLIKVDLTGNASREKALLHSLGSRSIPLLAIFPPGEKSLSPLILRDLYTTSDVDKALDNTLSPENNP